MSSSASPGRKIASNYLFTGGRLIADPLVEMDGAGCVVAVGRCAEPDRMAGVEFYAGILLPGLADACCGVLTFGSALRHRSDGTVSVGYTECSGDIPVVPGLALGPVGGHVHFLSRIIAGEPFQAGSTAIIIDTTVPPDFPDAAGWCLCPRTLGPGVLSDTVERFRRLGIVPVLGSYTPEPDGSRPLAECLPLFAGESISEMLAWATGHGVKWPDLKANEVVPGSYCGLNLLSGCDYGAMCLTEQVRVSRIV